VRANCPICAAGSVVRLDKRQRVPVLMHKLFDSAADAKQTPTGDIDLVRCRSCGFAWNRDFDQSAISYDPSYDNCQTHSAVFRGHVDTCARNVVASQIEKNQLHIVELGAGQGDFLKRLAAVGGARVASLTGFDPAWRGADGAVDSKISMYRRLFSAETSRLLPSLPDVVVSRHTIEHIAEPAAFLETIRQALDGREGVDVYIETPDISWIVQNQAIEDVFYEHCSIFDPESLDLAVTSAGFDVIGIESCFSGQYLWAHARSGSPETERTRRAPVSEMTITSADLLSTWRNRLEHIVAAGGKVVIWGSGAKGITFAQTVDPEGKLIAALVDINPGKHGRFIGVTGHRVLAPSSLPELHITHTVVMNPIYSGEIALALSALDLVVELIPIHLVAP
jgi:SAM-dependent methyltransferase